MRRINVDPQSLISSASLIDEKINELKLLEQHLYSGVDTLQQSWNGKDNIAFSNRIKNYQNTIRSISLIMGQYTDFLRNSANAYNQTQDELCNEALKMQI